MRKFIVKCPKCQNQMKTRIKDQWPKNHYKECVYCGNKFNIYTTKGKNIINNIVEEIK